MPIYKNLTLIHCGPVVASLMGNERHFLELLFDAGLVFRILPDQDSMRDNVEMIQRTSVHCVCYMSGVV